MLEMEKKVAGWIGVSLKNRRFAQHAAFLFLKLANLASTSHFPPFPTLPPTYISEINFA